MHAAVHPPLEFFTPAGSRPAPPISSSRRSGAPGLVPNRTYVLSDGRRRASGTADSSGTIIAQLAAPRGSTVDARRTGRPDADDAARRPAARRSAGERPSVLGGSCQPGDYWGDAAGDAADQRGRGHAQLSGRRRQRADRRRSARSNGNAAGLPTAALAQSDELSGGLTETEVPEILDTSPIDGESLYGKFTALAESGLLLPDNTVFRPTGSRGSRSQILTADGATQVFKAAQRRHLQGRDRDRPRCRAPTWRCGRSPTRTATPGPSGRGSPSSSHRVRRHGQLQARRREARRLVACNVVFARAAGAARHRQGQDHARRGRSSRSGTAGSGAARRASRCAG